MANEQKVGELRVKETDCFLLMVQTTVKLILRRELGPVHSIRCKSNRRRRRMMRIRSLSRS